MGGQALLGWPQRGHLDIYVVYLPAGGDGDAHGKRMQYLRKIKEHIRPRDKALSIIAGDFNFVEVEEDRISKDTGAATGGKDKSEAKLFKDLFRNGLNFHELSQETFTHANAFARSRLDRIYTNLELHEQLDRHIDCYALPYTSCSDHKAVSFSKTSPNHGGKTSSFIQSNIYKHPDFKRQVSLEYIEMTAKDGIANSAPRRLVILKRAIHSAAKCIGKEIQKTTAINAQDKVEWIMTFIRAAEKQNLRRMKQCATACPTILQYCHPDNPEARSTVQFQELKELVISLSRRDITDKIEALKGEEDGNEYRRSKESVMKKLKRLMPGNSTALAAIQLPSGDVSSDPATMATALKEHWGKVFKHKEIDQNLLETWLASIQLGARSEQVTMQELSSPHDKPLDRSRKPRTPLSRNPADWNVRRRDIRKAVVQSNDSSPGPDGIPFGVWRALGHLGIEILLDVAEFMEKGEAEATFIEAYQDECQEGEHNCNTSTLVCLPKEATGEDPELGA